MWAEASHMTVYLFWLFPPGCRVNYLVIILCTMQVFKMTTCFEILLRDLCWDCCHWECILHEDPMATDDENIYLPTCMITATKGSFLPSYLPGVQSEWPIIFLLHSVSLLAAFCPVCASCEGNILQLESESFSFSLLGSWCCCNVHDLDSKVRLSGFKYCLLYSLSAWSH